MLQRIQSIYLLIAGVLLGTQTLFPFARVENATGEALATMPVGNVFLDGLLNFGDSEIARGIAYIGAAFCILAIFRYKHRLRQMVSVWVCIVAALVVLGFMAYLGLRDKAALGSATISPDLGGLFPLAAIVFLFLALRGIRKDENTVRSMDRLR